jgi:hypothetical protein
MSKGTESRRLPQTPIEVPVANAASHEVSAADRAAFDTFTTELIAAGFDSIAGDEHHWRGPIDPSFRPFTEALSMRFEIRDGWPIRHPYLFVDGLMGRRHVNAQGNVCLWEESDDTLRWLHLEEIRDRIREWCDDQTHESSVPALDTHLYFDRWTHQLVVLDVDSFVAADQIRETDGEAGSLRAKSYSGIFTVGAVGPIPVRWYYRDSVPAPPSSSIAFAYSLTHKQRVDFLTFSEGRGRHRVALALLLWRDNGNVAITALLLTRDKATVALEVARNDPTILRLRSGPDAELLGAKSAVIFGLGAVGSHLAMLLARCGLSSLTLVDSAVLRPGDLARHASLPSFVGTSKAVATKSMVESITGTTATAITNELWATDALRNLCGATNLVIDATGNAAYTDLLSVIAAFTRNGLVAVALHRQGKIARVRVQVSGTAPILERSSASGFPVIPPLSIGGQLRWEAGCGAPINNAPPWSVSAAASLAVRVSLDVLADRLTDDVDVIDVYEPSQPPFDRRGLQEIRPKV